ncbi:AraC family transcriptional regulator, partial [Burkholderia thailandensis]|nr:AraC family transcriptional regulator [Burkholderia thailandensis]
MGDREVKPQAAAVRGAREGLSPRRVRRRLREARGVGPYEGRHGERVGVAREMLARDPALTIARVAKLPLQRART